MGPPACATRRERNELWRTDGVTVAVRTVAFTAENEDHSQFSHSLASLIGEQARAGLAIVDLYEDRWSEVATPLSRFFPVCFATLAVKA